MRIPATSGSVRRSVVAGLCPGYRRCRHRPRCRYPNSWPSRYRGSRYRASRGTGYRASWTSTPTWRWAWRWATLGHRTEAGPTWETTHPTVPHSEIPPRSRLDPRSGGLPLKLLVSQYVALPGAESESADGVARPPTSWRRAASSTRASACSTRSCGYLSQIIEENELDGPRSRQHAA
jgi:hypothetical protein